MSKLDRQLDAIHGAEPIVMTWSEEDDIAPEVIRSYLESQIDARGERIPLDLRGINGAPSEIVNLIKDAQRYARDQGKKLSVSHASLPMQEALIGHRRKPQQKPVVSERQSGAGDSAKSILDQTRKTEDKSQYDISKAEKISRTKRTVKKGPGKIQRYLLIGGLILIGTATVGAVEYFLIFNTTPDPINVPTKVFE